MHIGFQAGKTHWMRVNLKNTDTVDHAMKLFFNNVQAGMIRLYIQTGNHIDSGNITGSLVPVKERASKDRLLSIPFNINSGADIILYVKTFRKGIRITYPAVIPTA